MKLTTGLKMPSRGSIHIGGRPRRGRSRSAVWRFKRPRCCPGAPRWTTLLPLEIVEPHRSQFKQRRAEFEARAVALLQSVGLGGYERKYPLGAIGRHAAARQHPPCPGARAQDAAARRALWRTRCLHPAELWCTLRDLQAARKFNVILVTHDLRESVFLADTVYVMSKSPGRFIVQRKINLPRPRDLEVTYTSAFTDIVHELGATSGDSPKNG